ncbi:MAG: hypothetical protein GWP19_03290 [Planctomycetia bacterium]|nr:hypothetical protein [Planctomycetia bacterium]
MPINNMNSIQERFNQNVREHSGWSSFICFGDAIMNRNYSLYSVRKWFNKLVDEEDYDKVDKSSIIRFCKYLSNKKVVNADSYTVKN